MIRQKPMINYRQKTLIGLLGAFGGQLSNTDFQKYLFLYTQEFQKDPSFDFVPYKYGGFSFQSYADKRRLIEIGALADSDDWRVQNGYSIESVPDDNNEYIRCYDRYSDLRGEQLIKDVYRRFPYYAIKSEIAESLMSPGELNAIKAELPSESATCLYTIGYEGSSFDGFLNRLIKNNIKTLVDVRRNPLSRKYGFSKTTLSDTVIKLGMEYLHIPTLGIDSDKRQDLNSQADYDRLFDSYEKHDLKQNKDAVQKLFNTFLDRKRVAITCFEASVNMCHRGRLTKALSELPQWKYRICHI